jgi:circadian clock protein KaiB
MTTTMRNGLKRFERALTEQSREVYVLRLYVGGASPKSLEAIRNLRNICDENLAGRCQLEVVDIYQQPDRAARDQVVAVPMLVKQLPLPLRRLIGTLSNTGQILKTFGLITVEVDRATRRQERG